MQWNRKSFLIWKLWLSCLLQSVVSAHAELTGYYHLRTNVKLGGTAPSWWFGKHFAVIVHSWGIGRGLLAIQNGCTGAGCTGRLEQKSDSRCKDWCSPPCIFAPQPSSQAGYGVSGPPVCTAGQLSHLLPVNSLRSWSRSVTDPADVPGRGSDTVGVTMWLPMSLAPRSGCVSCQQHVNPSQGGPRPSAQAWQGAFPLTGKKATV